MNINILLVTSTAVTFEIDNNDNFFLEESISLKINNENIKLDKVVNTVYDLTPNTEYSLEFFKGEEKIHETEVKTLNEKFLLNVKKFGALGNGVSNDTLAIQTAIMACPADGRVYIPKGRYLITSLFLKDNLTLEFAEGAQLIGDTERENFGILPGLIDNDNNDEYYLGSWEGNPLDTFTSLITGINVKNVTILGKGIIDGRASRDNWWKNPKIKNKAWRPRTIFLNNCENINIEGITIKNSPSWTLHPFLTKNLNVFNIKIDNPMDSPNTDGFDPESCENLKCMGVEFSVGDDCIAIKSGKLYLGTVLNKPTKNFLIKHCLMKYGHGGLVIGSEMAGGAENIRIENCDFYQTDKGIRIKTRRGRGKNGVIDGIYATNISMNKVKVPFVINCFYFCDPDGKTEYVYTKEPLPIDDRIPTVKNINLKNITAKDTYICAGYLYGLPENPIDKVTLDNVTIDFTSENVEPDYPAMMSFIEPEAKTGFFMENIKDISLNNLTIKNNTGEKIRIGKNCKDNLK